MFALSRRGKVSKGTAGRSFSSVCPRNEVDRDGKPTGRTGGRMDRTVRGESRVTFDLAPARLGTVTRSHVAGIKRDVP